MKTRWIVAYRNGRTPDRGLDVHVYGTKEQADYYYSRALAAKRPGFDRVSMGLSTDLGADAERLAAQWDCRAIRFHRHELSSIESFESVCEQIAIESEVLE